MTARGRRSRGSAAVEFAFAAGLLAAAVSGAFRVGYSIYVYEQLVSAAGAAARYAARADFDLTGAAFAAEVKNMAVYGSPAGGGVPVITGLTPANVQVTWTRDARNVPLTVTVSIVNFSVNAAFQRFQWSGKPSVKVRYAGLYKS